MMMMINLMINSFAYESLTCWSYREMEIFVIWMFVMKILETKMFFKVVNK